MPQGISLNIGLNAVDPGHYAGWDGVLQACEADADDMESIAKAQGFQTKKLLTKQATRKNVVNLLGQASKTLKRGDTFLFSYSGHGGQLPDRNSEEDDGLDETWCLYDGEIIDDEIYVMLGKFAEGVRVFMLSDSCHSGTVSRMAYGALRSSGSLGLLVDSAEVKDGGEPPGMKLMPQGIVERTYRNNRDMYDGIMSKLPKHSPVPNIKASVLLISGCQDNQTSSDGTYNGLFTANLLRVWNGGKFRGDYRTFHKRIVRRMPPLQSPNYSVVGRANPEFERSIPFHLQ
ncbi:caspase family protein [Myxococcaceae bacterium GXIMD 01537]